MLRFFKTTLVTNLLQWRDHSVYFSRKLWVSGFGLAHLHCSWASQSIKCCLHRSSHCHWSNLPSVSTLSSFYLVFSQHIFRTRLPLFEAVLALASAFPVPATLQGTFTGFVFATAPWSDFGSVKNSTWFGVAFVVICNENGKGSDQFDPGGSQCGD